MEVQSKGESSDTLQLKAEATPDPLWCSLKNDFARENEMIPDDVMLEGSRENCLYKQEVPVIYTVM